MALTEYKCFMLVKWEAMWCLALSLVALLVGVTQFLQKLCASRKPVKETDFMHPFCTGAWPVLCSRCLPAISMGYFVEKLWDIISMPSSSCLVHFRPSLVFGSRSEVFLMLVISCEVIEAEPSNFKLKWNTRGKGSGLLRDAMWCKGLPHKSINCSVTSSPAPKIRWP